MAPDRGGGALRVAGDRPAIRLRPLQGSEIARRRPGRREKAPKSQIQELKNRAVEIQKLVAANRAIAAFGTFSGRLTLQTGSSIPAKLVFDDARDITIEVLPEASKLPVIPICDLFQDLPKYKDQRIAVRAEIGSTMEGVWLRGHCKGNFVTHGYRWPVLLTYGVPDYFGAEPASLFRDDQRKINFPRQGIGKVSLQLLLSSGGC